MGVAGLYLTGAQSVAGENSSRPDDSGCSSDVINNNNLIDLYNQSGTPMDPDLYMTCDKE